MRRCLCSTIWIVIAVCKSAQGAGTQDFSPPKVESIGQLRLDTDAPETEHTVRGVVTRVGVPLYLQDRTGGIEVVLRAQGPALRIGDEVIVTGRLVPLRYSSRLERAVLKVLAPGVPEPPLSITTTMASSGNYDRVYVETEGVLRGVRKTNDTLWLMLDGGREPFMASVPMLPTAAFANRIVLQARVRVRGICIMDDRRSGETTPFTIVTVSIDDVNIVSPPPFWGRAHVLELICLILVVGIGVMVAYIRMERWRFSLILDERTRMAHDLHDTLAQGFTGVAFQLLAIRNAVRAGADNIEKQMSLAIAMVSDSQEDARRSIAMLKPSDLDTGNVLENLRQQGEALTHGGRVAFSIASSGDVERIPKAVNNILLRIGHEAITNALRHADPKAIAISLAVTSESVALDISDNGCGFAVGGPRTRGFGIRAMHARAHSYGGSLDIVSSPASGTTVQVRFPLLPKRAHFWKVLSILSEENHHR